MKIPNFKLPSFLGRVSNIGAGGADQTVICPYCEKAGQKVFKSITNDYPAYFTCRECKKEYYIGSSKIGNKIKHSYLEISK